jgi:HTH-type transcriptional regulator / antitoxin HigA
MPERHPHPGEYVKAELVQRGWTQADLAQILGKHTPAINEVVQGKRAISPEMAVALGTAFGTGPEVWMNRETEYRLSLLSREAPEIAQRARLFDLAPVKEMEKRGWIRPTASADELEKQLTQFFRVESLDQEPAFNAVARKSEKRTFLSPAQRAWCVRAARLAETIEAAQFKHSDLEVGFRSIRKLADFPEKARHVPRVLAEIGIRFLVVEHLPQTKIDGATFWLSSEAPVVVLSMRHDRIDGFWFTLAHELMHVKHGDAESIDSDMVGETRHEHESDIEARADREAAEMLIPKHELESFIVRVKPFYSKARINQFAMRLKVHPGIVTGQLQHRGEINFGTNREMLAKLRHILVAETLTDGWGHSLPPFLKNSYVDRAQNV